MEDMGQLQFKLRLDPKFVANLAELAKRYNKKNAQEVATEILEQYLILWVRGAESAKQALEAHFTSLGTGKLPGANDAGRVARDIQKARGIAKSARNKNG